jgi:hypothetical protein
VQASLDYKQRLQQLFFPEGIAFDGNRFNRTAVTAPLFKYLAPSESAEESLVSRVGIEPDLDPDDAGWFATLRITPHKSLAFIGGVSALEAGRALRCGCRDTFDNET